MKQMNMNIWILLNMCEWLIGVKTIRTTCKSMDDLIAKTSINCKPGEIIFVNEQSINFLGSDYPKRVINNNECKNSTSSKCFRYLAKDYSSYFNISNSCNGKEKCTLGYNDMYNSAIQFTRSCEYSQGSDFDLLRIGISNECFNYKNQIIVRKTISEIRDGSLYLRSNETGRCLITGSIKSARILEHVNMKFNISGRKSRLCTKMLTNGSFVYNEDLSCLAGVNGFYLDIQATKTKPRKLWMEFKGTLLQLACGDNIQLPSESEQNVRSTLFPMIMGLVAGLLLLLALILVVLKRRHALTIRAETKRCTINLTTTLEGDQDCTYYNNDVDKTRNNANDVQGTSSSFDESFYSLANTDANYAQINIKKNTSEFERNNGLQNVKNGTNDTEKSREESLDSDNVNPVSSKMAENKPNTMIGEVTGDVYAAVCKTDDLKSMHITGPKGDIYTTVSMVSNVE